MAQGKTQKVYTNHTKVCKNESKIPVYGDGLNVRDWIYVKDLLRLYTTYCRAQILIEMFTI